MTDRPQLEASVPQESGVALTHLDSEGDLVCNALAWPVSARKKFNVLNVILRSLAVLMVNRFLWSKRPTDVLLHDPAVLKHLTFLARRTRKSRDGNPDIAVTLYVPTVVATRKAFLSFSHLPVALAPSVAKPLLSVKEQGSLTALVFFHRLMLAALFAGKKGSRFSVGPSADSRALDRTIPLINAPLFAVLAKKAGALLKFFAASFAGKRDWRLGLPMSLTGVTAVFSFWSGLRALCTKHLTARLTWLHVHGKYLRMINDNYLYPPAELDASGIARGAC